MISNMGAGDSKPKQQTEQVSQGQKDVEKLTTLLTNIQGKNIADLDNFYKALPETSNLKAPLLNFIRKYKDAQGINDDDLRSAINQIMQPPAVPDAPQPPPISVGGSRYVVLGDGRKRKVYMIKGRACVKVNGIWTPLVLARKRLAKITTRK
jgi:hypothetical protein